MVLQKVMTDIVYLNV